MVSSTVTWRSVSGVISVSRTALAFGKPSNEGRSAWRINVVRGTANRSAIGSPMASQIATRLATEGEDASRSTFDRKPLVRPVRASTSARESLPASRA